MIGFRLFRSQMPSLLLYALFPRVKQKELTSFTIASYETNFTTYLPILVTYQIGTFL